MWAVFNTEPQTLRPLQPERVLSAIALRPAPLPLQVPREGVAAKAGVPTATGSRSVCVLQCKQLPTTNDDVVGPLVSAEERVQAGDVTCWNDWHESDGALANEQL